MEGKTFVISPEREGPKRQKAAPRRRGVVMKRLISKIFGQGYESLGVEGATFKSQAEAGVSDVTVCSGFYQRRRLYGY